MAYTWLVQAAHALCSHIPPTWVYSILAPNKAIRAQDTTRSNKVKGQSNLHYVIEPHHNLALYNYTHDLLSCSYSGEFQRFVGAIKARGGGNDGPEDVMGGLKVVFSKLNWREGACKVGLYTNEAVLTAFLQTMFMHV